MAKKNANNAIDFTRLLAVKDNLPSTPPLTSVVEAEPAAGREGAGATATLLDFPSREPAQPPREQGGSDLAEEALPSDYETVVLRIGMSRALHDRVRATAALDGKSPAHLARELLARRTPAFLRSTPMATLAKQARDSFPASMARSRIDVRMQVPLDSDLHRRLHQLAALRTQTLVACISDLFEASVQDM
ncbi:MAG TPA: hypothetical protein VIJ33_05230 [Solirubrobacteraceae bacterium]